MSVHVITVTLDMPAVRNLAGARFRLLNRLATPGRHVPDRSPSGGPRSNGRKMCGKPPGAKHYVIARGKVDVTRGTSIPASKQM